MEKMHTDVSVKRVYDGGCNIIACMRSTVTMKTNTYIQRNYPSRYPKLAPHLVLSN